MAAKLNRLILQLQAEKIVSGSTGVPAGPASQAPGVSVGDEVAPLMRAAGEGRDQARAGAEASSEARAPLLHLPARRRAHG
jgi:hypothetical protein